jgi:hypothetical protein
MTKHTKQFDNTRDAAQYRERVSIMIFIIGEKRMFTPLHFFVFRGLIALILALFLAVLHVFFESKDKKEVEEKRHRYEGGEGSPAFS